MGGIETPGGGDWAPGSCASESPRSFVSTGSDRNTNRAYG